MHLPQRHRQSAAVLEGGDISKGGAVMINQPSGQVAVAAGNSLYAVKASDGSVVWSKAVSRSTLGDPAVGNPKLAWSPRILVPNGVINSCYSNTTGAVRVIDSAASCGSAETQLGLLSPAVLDFARPYFTFGPGPWRGN